jgi:hypothetical protein
VDGVGQRGLIEQIGGHQLEPVDEVRDPLVRGGRAATDDADDAIPLGEQQLGEVGAVLAGDAGDQSRWHDGSVDWV